MKYTLTLYVTETRTSQRTIELEAETLEAAQGQLLALPEEQFVREEDGSISITGMACLTSANVKEWAYGDWDVEDSGLDDPQNVLEPITEGK